MYCLAVIATASHEKNRHCL